MRSRRIIVIAPYSGGDWRVARARREGCNEGQSGPQFEEDLFHFFGRRAWRSSVRHRQSEAAFFEDASRGQVVGGDNGKERPLCECPQEPAQGQGCDSLSPVSPADPITDLAALG